MADSSLKKLQQQIGKMVLGGLFIGATTVLGFTINMYADVKAMKNELQNVTELSNSNAKDVVNLEKNFSIHKAITEPKVLGE